MSLAVGVNQVEDQPLAEIGKRKRSKGSGVTDAVDTPYRIGVCHWSP